MASAQWFAVWTHSHWEQLVHDQLTAKGLRAVDKASHLEILKTKGVVRILGERWDRLTPVADVEIEALQRVVNSDLMVLSHSYLREGQRVRIEAGPLAGVEGLFVRGQPNRGLLVLSVNLIHQSVAVEVDCTSVVPATPTPGPRLVLESSPPS